MVPMMGDERIGAGRVTLVGGGPGAPGLMTLAGRRAIERADVVLYDHLTSPALLASVPVVGQERIHVGKTAGAGLHVQNAINELIVERAGRGQRCGDVVRPRRALQARRLASRLNGRRVSVTRPRSTPRAAPPVARVAIVAFIWCRSGLRSRS